MPRLGSGSGLGLANPTRTLALTLTLILTVTLTLTLTQEQRDVKGRREGEELGSVYEGRRKDEGESGSRNNW